MSLNIGDVIDDKYRILRMIGEGGMGAVYEGENRLISRKVAIKVLYGAASMSQDAIQRFEREAQAAGRIGNDHILEIIDLGRLPDGARYMVMEFLDGETLGQRIAQKGRLTAQELVPVFKQVLVGLQAAHDAGIVHRDLKPDNIFILKNKANQKDFVKIIDFGISKFQDPSDHNMTRTGTVMGTPFYMSPEQAKGVGVDARSDLYSVAAMLYEGLSGTVPFDGKTFNELMFKIVLSEPRPLIELVPELDPAFASVVQKGMARDSQHRFASARDFGEALDRWSTTGAGVTLPPEATNAAAEFGATQLPQPGMTPSLPAGSAALGAGRTQAGMPVAAAGAASAGAVSPGTAPGQSGGGAATHGNWANSQPAMAQAGGRKWLPFAIGGGAVALLGVIAMAMMGGSKPADTSATPPPPAPAAAAPAQPAEAKPAEVKPAEPKPAAAPAEQPAAVVARPAAAAVAPAATAPAASKPAAPAASQTPKASRTTQPTTTAPVVKKPAAVKPATKGKVDFGY
ncbi:MAG TPA: serine/threonine-protein kinase [Polyangiaceae bacterium]|nr:serine/threonine-protein kinase [Polyangiaceae bacterium]